MHFYVVIIFITLYFQTNTYFKIQFHSHTVGFACWFVGCYLKGVEKTSEHYLVLSLSFLLHHRYLTMQFYLSSVEEGGETTFPVADNRTYEEQVCVLSDYSHKPL